MAINAEWHAKHRMPKGARLGERIRWHVAHAKACACRPIPASVAAAIRERAGRAAPSAAGAGAGRRRRSVLLRGERAPHPPRVG